MSRADDLKSILEDMQELAEMKLTMANLKKWYELLIHEQKLAFEKSIEQQRNKLNALKEGKGENV